MAKQSKYTRPHEVIMQADFVRLRGEASIRWPYSEPYFYKLKSERRIRTYGSPASIKASEFEAQMQAGFPKLEDAEAAA